MLLMIMCASTAAATDWPSQDAVMISNFGAPSAGGPALGDTFRADGPVAAVEKGELLFRRGTKSPASRFVSPLGAMTALDHGDGIISIYSRTADTSPAPQNLAASGEMVAEAGISGWSAVKGFYLSVFDRKDRRWVNPSLVIPVIPDTRPPLIRSVRLKSKDNQIVDLAASRVIRQGVYTIIVHAEDTVNTSAAPLMPMRIICSINGVEAGVLAFETFSAHDGKLMMFRNGLVPVSQVYEYSPAVEVGEVAFSRGQVTLDIVVQDIATLQSSAASANSSFRRASYRLFVE